MLNDLHLKDAAMLQCECIYKASRPNDSFIPRLFSLAEQCPTLNTSNALVEEIKFASKLKVLCFPTFCLLGMRVFCRTER